MPSSQNGNIGLWSGYTPGDNGWTSQHNQSWDALDALAQLAVKSMTTTTPPGSPANGDAYIVPAGATGAWASNTNKIAVWVARSSAWVMYTPKQGWIAFVVNDTSDGSNSGNLYKYNGSAWSLVIPVINWTYRNLLINADGRVNQRGYVSGTATTSANQYTVDRWKVQTSGQNLSWTTSGAIATFTAPAGGVAQVIEGGSIIGGTYCLSWQGTATATVNGTAITNGAAFTLTGGSNATVVFSGGTFSQPQLELGVSPTPYEFRPIAAEIDLCLRYYQKVTASSGNAFVGATHINSSTALGYMYLPTQMRVAPTTTISGTIQYVESSSNLGTGAAPTFTSTDVYVVAILLPISGGTVGNGGYFSASGGAAMLSFSAEL